MEQHELELSLRLIDGGGSSIFSQKLQPLVSYHTQTLLVSMYTADCIAPFVEWSFRELKIVNL